MAYRGSSLSNLRPLFMIPKRRYCAIMTGPPVNLLIFWHSSCIESRVVVSHGDTAVHLYNYYWIGTINNDINHLVASRWNVASIVSLTILSSVICCQRSSCRLLLPNVGIKLGIIMIHLWTLLGNVQYKLQYITLMAWITASRSN